MRKAYISNIQKFCVHDGPGIRTVVFFMGCPLRCMWCQNPENFYNRPVMMFDFKKCTSCGMCIQKCKRQAIYKKNTGEIVTDRNLCVLCGDCTSCCRQQAREICGNAKTVDDVFEEVMKDEIFFRNTGGGITLSGGECTMFPEFTVELLEKFKARGIHTAIETSGYCKHEDLKIIENETDLFLYDLKLITPALHKIWTGQGNGLIMKNLEHLVSSGRRVVIRIPLISGVNDGVEFGLILEYLRKLRGIKEIHLLPFHQLGACKYRLSGQSYEMHDWQECSKETVEKCTIQAENEGFKVNVGGWNL